MDFYPLIAFIHYWLRKEDKFSIQSPFLATLYSGLKSHLKNTLDSPDPFLPQRKQLASDRDEIEVLDFGAGSKKLKSNLRSTYRVYKYSTSGRKFSTLYSYFCAQTPALHVIELGTCLGINCLYLATSTQGVLYSFEGSPSLLTKAKAINPFSNIKYILGDIATTLPKHLKQPQKVDFALIDATHTYQATISYLNALLPETHEESIIVVADIHWSKEMEKAWKEIIQYPSVTLSLDFFECGVLFFRKTLTKSHYVLAI